MAHDVFVSHSAKDKTVSDALVARLEAEGIRCWVAPRDVVPGADWGESIIDAIESSRIMVLIFSASANGSPQIKREIERAVDKGVYTIPFRIEDVQPTKALEYFISSAHWLDAFSQPLAQHFDSLARTLKAILATPRPGSAAETAPPVTARSENAPVSFPDANRSPAPPAPEQGTLAATPPPPPAPPPAPPLTHVERQTPFSPAPAAPQRPKKTMWTLIIVGILALLLVANLLIAGVVYLVRLPTTPATKSRVSSLPIPPEKELKKLALDTLLLFNDAVQTKSFKAFHAKLGTTWKKEITPQKLLDVFHGFVDQRIDFAEIEDVAPTFDTAPALNANGWLVFKGHYTLKDRDVLFELKYENEQASWKLVGINVQTKPHRQTAATPAARNERTPRSTVLENSDGVPSEKEIEKLVLDTLLLFNDAVQARNFKAFHAKLGPAWKKDATPRALLDSFHDFTDKHIDFSDIEDVAVTFDVAPAVNQDGWLVVKGHYTLKTSDVLFELKYENDQGSWKLVSINIQTKPHRT